MFQGNFKPFQTDTVLVLIVVLVLVPALFWDLRALVLSGELACNVAGFYSVEVSRVFVKLSGSIMTYNFPK